MHHVQGRNFLHKYRQALAIVPKPQSAVGLTKCVSEDRVSSPENGQASPHRYIGREGGRAGRQAGRGREGERAGGREQGGGVAGRER